MLYIRFLNLQNPLQDVEQLYKDGTIKPGDIVCQQYNDKYSHLFQDMTLVCGGPPCQGFSMANRQRIIDDPRNSLYKQYLIFLQHVRPKFFIMENVKGMMNKITEILQNFEEFLGDDYKFDYAVLKAQDYGVPQNRERVFMVSIRNDIERNTFTFPYPRKLQTVLADILEQDADKSFFLKDEMVEKFLRNNEKEGDEYIYRVTERKFTEGDLQEILANG